MARRLLVLMTGFGALYLVLSACGLLGQSPPPAAQQQSDHTTVVSTGDNGAMYLLLGLAIAAAAWMGWRFMHERIGRVEDRAMLLTQQQVPTAQVPMLNGHGYQYRVPVDYRDEHKRLGR